MKTSSFFKVFVLLLACVVLTVSAATAQDTTLTFASWGGDAEIAAFERIIEGFEAANPGVTIDFQILTAQNFVEQIEVQLAAGQGPDVLRGGFRGDIVRYASLGGVIDLSSYLDEGYADEFLPSALELMLYEGQPFGLPLHTDTFGLYYNVETFEQLGIVPPASMEECWTYDEFLDIARRVQAETDADFGFSHLATNGKRWLALLYENSGQLLSEDLSTVEIQTEAALDTIAWTQTWYTERLVPPGNSMRGQELPQNLFANGLAGMLIHGNYIMPFLADAMPEGSWGVTYMPCSTGQGADFGGTGLAVTRDSQNPEIAAEFVKFATNAENMADFVSTTLFLPVRPAVVEAGVEFTTFNDEMQFFSELITEINPEMARIMALPTFPQIDRVITDQMELAWTSGQSTEDTAQNIADGVSGILDLGE